MLQKALDRPVLRKRRRAEPRQLCLRWRAVRAGRGWLGCRRAGGAAPRGTLPLNCKHYPDSRTNSRHVVRSPRPGRFCPAPRPALPRCRRAGHPRGAVRQAEPRGTAQLRPGRPRLVGARRMGERRGGISAGGCCHCLARAQCRRPAPPRASGPDQGRSGAYRPAAYLRGRATSSTLLAHWLATRLRTTWPTFRPPWCRCSAGSTLSAPLRTPSASGSSPAAAARP